MNTKPGIVAAAMALSLGWAGAADAQSLELRLDSPSRKLTLVEPVSLPTVTAGQQFVVRVRGVTAEPTWKLVLSGDTLRFGSTDQTGASFSTMVGAGVQPSAGHVRLTVSDPAPTDKVTLDEVVMNFRAGGGSGAVQPSPVPQGCDLTPAVPLNRPKKGENHVLLLFNEQGFPLRPVPTDLDENDAISITLLLPCAEAGAYSVQLEGTLANGEMHVLSSGALESLSKLRTQLTSAGRDTFYVGTFGPFAPPKVTVILKKGTTEIRRHEMRVLKNYIGAFRLGVGRSNIRFNDFQLRASASGDTTKVITNRSDPDGEPRYYVSAVFYAWHFWDNRFWNGRDLSEPPALIDRINPFVGVGLKEPGREYLFGLTFELARGLDVVWGTHVARTDQLTNGITEGTVFRGTQQDIPVQYEWKTAYNFLGFSVDLETGVDILQGILGK